ncbi:hypothetical protein JFL43_13840 [Viridibacillus sp. YIM B01967]|uniref:DUF4352 domain-containing protein n=1 Tax=Viridibacillus soli TaxID=2798301 RepID=A0ABS1H920_9BACL|nr:hypothetical protein [Viridibacillus soli]MBK3495922.1 hypothetical protein [Viridibacillus soli]
MTNLGIVPVLFILLIILLVVTLLQSKSYRTKLNQRPLKIFIIVYVAILAVAPIIYFILPKEEKQVLTDNGSEKLNLENKALREALFKNETASIDERFLIDEWTRTFKEKEIYLKMENPDEGEKVNIIVQTSDKANEQITGKLYRKNFIENYIYIPDKLNKPTIIWRNEKTMAVKNPTAKKLSYVTVSDKLNKGGFNNEESHSVVVVEKWDDDGPYYLLLTIPKDVKVWSDEGLRIYD